MLLGYSKAAAKAADDLHAIDVNKHGCHGYSKMVNCDYMVQKV